MRKLFFLLCLVFLSVNGWGACYNTLQTGNIGNAEICNCQTCPQKDVCMGACPEGNVFSAVYPNRYYIQGTNNTANSSMCTRPDVVCGAQAVSMNCTYRIYCDSKCEADSISCINLGNTWTPGSGGQCGTCNDNSVCEPLKQQCEEAGGTFTGTTASDNGQNCCRASCNVCNSNAMNSMYEAKKKICCENGLAPPNKDQTCNTVRTPTAGCGMVWSNYGDFTSDGWQCADPSSSWEAGARRSECFVSSSSNDGESSSSVESSSSAGGGSSSSAGGGDYGDCKECPWLDSILDTLKAQKDIVSGIYQCVQNPALCSVNTESNSGDTVAIPDWVAEKMDSSLLFDTLKIHYIDSIKQILESALYTDSASLKADSIALHMLSTDLENIDNTIKSLSDTTRDLFRRLSNSNKINTESLTVHIDSLYKYQKMISESMDSAIYGSGGFNKIDGMTDSAIKYFRQIRYYDSVYHKNFADSLGALHTAISDIGVNIGYNLGYGDTASSNLRQDLGGIKGAIDGIGNMLNGSSVDTNANSGIWGNGDGERLGDSIVNASGWNRLKNMNVDSIYSDALGHLSSDTVGNGLNDSLSGVLENLNDSLARRNDSLKSHLPDSLNKWADSLIIWAPFAGFDSLIYESIGAHVPNRDDCPEECQKWTVSIPVIHLYSYTFDYGLCLGRAPLGNQSVMAFIKLLLRIVVAWTCIVLIYRTLTKTDLL